MYQKPHLTYMKQLETLSKRGMDIGDTTLCLEELKRLGYYRLSAYSYPFRRLLPEECRESSTNYRSEDFVSGTTFGTVVELADFDSDLRRLIFEALEQIEVVLRTKVAYRAGREDAFIHKNRSLLDDDRCSSTVKSGGQEVTRWKAWKSKFNLLMKQAKNEDFYKHFEEKYQGKMPIWVVIEFVDFGGLTRFYYLLRSKLQSAIAKEFGVTSGATFSNWLVNLNYLRNKVAHHNRVWNRTMTYKLQKPNLNEVGKELDHLRLRENDLDSTYDYLALIAYLMQQICPNHKWSYKIVSLMDSFPQSSVVSLEKDMGFPHGWRLLKLWS